MTSKSYKNLSPNSFKLNNYLNDIGYNVNYFVSGSHRNWTGYDKLFNTNVDYYCGEGNTQFATADDRIIFTYLDSFVMDESKPQFFYFHLMSTHGVSNLEEKFINLLGNLDSVSSNELESLAKVK